MNHKLEFYKKQLLKAEEDYANFDGSKLSESQREANIERFEKKIAGLMDSIEREQLKLQKSAAAKLTLDENNEIIADAIPQWIEQNPYYYVQKNNAYVKQLSEGCYETFSAPSMKEMHTEWNDNNFRLAVSAEMENQNRKFEKMTYSFNDLGPHYLNLMSKEHWIKPIMDEEPHWLFETLTYALAGGKAENQEHIERVICYKYMHPEEYKLPALVIFGEGAIGKNLLVDVLLASLFGRYQTLSAKAQDILGSFNSSIKGKTVVLINEAVSDKTDQETLKDLLQKPRININEKNIAHYEIDNTPLYILGGNSPDSAVKLAGDNSDRRYSIIKVDRHKTLSYWISVITEMSLEEARQWLVGGADRELLQDETEIGKWIGSLITKYGNQKLPFALHGQDYKELAGKQRNMEERIIRAVFEDPDFKCIERKTLYTGYRYINKSFGSGYNLKDNNFYTAIDRILPDYPHIEVKENHRWKGSKTKKRLIVNAQKPLPLIDNREMYLDNLDRWIGPDID